MANKGRLPLLFIIAFIIFSSPATSTSNEGFHQRGDAAAAAEPALAVQEEGRGLLPHARDADVHPQEQVPRPLGEKEVLASGFLDLDEVRSVLGIDLADGSGDGSEGDNDSDASVHIDLADGEL